MTEPILSVNNLEASTNETPILNGVSLCMGAREVHVLMGPNGSGKSTLAHAIMGSPAVTVTAGSVAWSGEDITQEVPEARARRGLFLGFQHPVELVGVGMETFVRSVRAVTSMSVGASDEFKKNLEARLKHMGLGSQTLGRNVNEGFSGGEKKRNELFQLSVFRPKVAIMDEIDSGLDVDGVQMATEEFKEFIAGGGSLLLITHSGNLARSLNPQSVYIMKGGIVVKTGGKELLDLVEAQGFESI